MVQVGACDFPFPVINFAINPSITTYARAPARTKSLITTVESRPIKRSYNIDSRRLLQLRHVCLS